ncbi:hypothetical protein AURDEDRAFT_167416 [Auricularia subglabra TFB-10046 SS5]|nr:hypothetical protein AURDEDRAFT_167416 [Auricularia subglabra TFB-10046 SS5]
MVALVDALTADLSAWKTWEEDEEEWVALTVATIKLQCNGRPLAALQDTLQRGREVSTSVRDLASLAQKESSRQLKFEAA